jgi:hypothetical protein
MGNFKLILAKYLFSFVMVLFSLVFLLRVSSPEGTQTGFYIIASLMFLFAGVVTALLSAGKITGKIARILVIPAALLAAFLAYANYDTINDNIAFDREMRERYNAVRMRLEKIREAQIAYRKVKGEYTSDFDELIRFLRNDSTMVVNKIGADDDSLAMMSGDPTRWSRDTVYVPVLGKLFNPKNYPIDSLPYIPFSGGVRFNLDAGMLEMGDDIKTPVFESFAYFASFLAPIGEKYGQIVPDSIIQVGSMSEPTTNGNWR